MTNEEFYEIHALRQQKRKVLLEQYVMQLETRAMRSMGRYRFHPAIEKVSGKLYRDGSYKSAALEAYTCVINAVRDVSSIEDNKADSLMNRAFSLDGKRLPVIQFNSLKTQEEKDEQIGFMYLYKGLVGLRNSKAHSNRLINNPNRAYEYLALASLLRSVLDVATVNKAEGR